MYGCESWTMKKAEHLRIDAFKLCCWRRLLRVPWTAKRSNQSVFKEMSVEYSLEGLILKLQYSGYLMRRAKSLEDSDARKDWGQEEKRAIEDEMVGWHYWLNGHEFDQTLWDSEGQGSLACCSPWSCKEWTQLCDWITDICGSVNKDTKHYSNYFPCPISLQSSFKSREVGTIIIPIL